MAVGAPGLDDVRRRLGRRQEPSRRGRAFVPRPPGVVDVRERASKRETPSRGREGAKRGGCGGAGRAELEWVGAAARRRLARPLSPTSSVSGGGSGRCPSPTPRGPADLAGKRPQEARRPRRQWHEQR